jgi:hypothetical protein
LDYRGKNPAAKALLRPMEKGHSFATGDGAVAELKLALPQRGMLVRSSVTVDDPPCAR